MNGLDLCLETIKGHINHCDTFTIEYLRNQETWFQRNTNRKWHMGNQMVTWSLTSRNPKRSNSWRSGKYA